MPRRHGSGSPGGPRTNLGGRGGSNLCDDPDRRYTGHATACDRNRPRHRSPSMLRHVQTDIVGHRTASDGETPGYSARSAALSATQPVAAITRCPHMNFAKTARRSSQRSNFLLRHRTPGEVTSPKPLTSSWTVSSLNVKRDTHDSSIGRGDSPLDTKVQSLYRMLTMQMS